RLAARHRQGGLAHDVVRVVHLERHIAGAFARPHGYQHRGAAALRRRRPLAQQGAEVHDRHQPPAQRREPAHRGQGARHVEHLGQVADLEHAAERQSVLLAVDADQQVPAAHGRPPMPAPRATRSTSIRSAISLSGNTASTPPSCTAAVGIPAITAEPRSWAIPPPPAARIARTPSAPSRPIPVRTTPRLCAPNTWATERNSGSAAGRTPHTGGPWSSAITGPSGARSTRI